MSRLKTTASLLGAAAMALSVAACGGGSDSEYCDLISSTDQDFPDLAGSEPPDPETMADIVTRFNDIAAAAPDDVGEDWRTVATGMEAIAAVDETNPEASADALEAIQNMEAVFDSVTEHAESECDIELS